MHLDSLSVAKKYITALEKFVEEKSLINKCRLYIVFPVAKKKYFRGREVYGRSSSNKGRFYTVNPLLRKILQR